MEISDKKSTHIVKNTKLPVNKWNILDKNKNKENEIDDEFDNEEENEIDCTDDDDSIDNNIYDKKICRGITQKGNPCTRFASKNSFFCNDFHKDMQSYTVDQIDKYLVKSSKCKKCYNLRLIEENKNYCVSCEKNYPKCIAVMPNGNICGIRAHYGLKYCVQSHDQFNKFPEDINNNKKCKKCAKIRIHKEDSKYCLECTNNVIIKIPMTSIDIEKQGLIEGQCYAIVNGYEKCSHRTIGNNIYCSKHTSWSSYSNDEILNYDKCKKCCKFKPGISKSSKYCKTCTEKNLANNCNGLDIYGNKCIYKTTGNDGYCIRSHGDMNNYTEYQKNNISICPKCKRNRFVKDNICTMCTISKNNQCIGKTHLNSPCENELTNSYSKTCDHHAYMRNYTDDMIKNSRICSGCPSPKKYIYYEGELCNKCIVLREKEEKKKENKCIGLQYNGEACRNNRIENKNVCTNHIDLESYNLYMLKNMKYCKTGKHYRYCGNYDTCEKCRNISKKNRETNSNSYFNSNSNFNKCNHIGCVFKSKNNELFCGTHIFDKYLLEAKEKNCKLCTNYNRNCEQKYLPIDYPYKKCDGCREKERINEQKRTQQRKENGSCSNCGKKSNDPADFLDFRGEKTAKCKACRVKLYEREKIALSEGRKKLYAPSEQRKEKKKLWRKNNHQKVASYWINYRARKMNELGDDYWINNARKAREYRESLSDERKFMLNENKRKNIKAKLNYYKCRAKLKNIIWNIDDDYAFELFNDKCIYCNCDPDDYYNGIDRIDNAKGYELTNVATACRICNMLKACMDYDIFLKRCEHILTHLKIIKGRLHMDIFPKSKSMQFNKYVSSAQKRNIEFKLTENQYNLLVSGSCYLCGTPSFNNHINGIDRYDSSLGYTIDNSRTCCSGCNYMKNKYPYDEFIKNIKNIYEHNKDIIKIYDNNNNDAVNIISNEIYFYKSCKSLNTMSRMDYYIPNIMIGKWDISSKPTDEMFLILESNYDNTVKLNRKTILLDNEYHKIDKILLSQGHYAYINNNDDNTDYRMIKTTHDSMIYIDIPNNHKILQVDTYYHDNKVVKITFTVDANMKGYCKCESCYKHNEEKLCLCNLCFEHRVHGDIDRDKCYWCSKDYTGNRYKNKKTKIHGDRHITKKYTCTYIENNTYSIKNAFEKKRREDIANNVKAYAEKNTDEYKANKKEYMKNYRRDKKNNNFVKKAVKISQQKSNETQLRKQKSRQIMRDKYNNQQWRDSHIIEIQEKKLLTNSIRT